MTRYQHQASILCGAFISVLATPKEGVKARLQVGATCPYGKDPSPPKFPGANKATPGGKGKPNQVRSLAEIMGRN